jgi:carbon monoxide dehydrogenase subunit G
MSDLSTFESRTGNLACTPSEVFDFVTDISNFKQFIPDGTSINALHIERESCSFNITSLGNVNLTLTEKKPHDKVVYDGTVFKSNSFSLVMDIKKNTAGKAEVHLKLTAQLNPVLRMMAAEPVENFLGKMIEEMEKFRGWNADK